MPRVSSLISIAVHAVIISAAVLWSVLAPDTLPSPRTLLAYEDVAMVKIEDIPLPTPPRPPSTHSQPTVSTNEPPTEAPRQITEETGLEGVRSPGIVRDIGVVRGIDGGVPGIEGTVVAPTPPPPQPRTPPAPVPVGGKVQPPRKIVDVRPDYPMIAQASRREGVVILEVVIDERGDVSKVVVLRSIPLLDEAAVAAVRQWKFTPTRLNGEAVPIVMTVTVNFTLSK